jgi:hypothetical protein
MIGLNERLLNDDVQKKILELFHFNFERCGYADCILNPGEKPSIRRTDVYKRGECGVLPGLTLIITDAGINALVVINDQKLQNEYHYESVVSKSRIVSAVAEYMKKHGYQLRLSEKDKDIVDGYFGRIDFQLALPIEIIKKGK